MKIKESIKDRWLVDRSNIVKLNKDAIIDCLFEIRYENPQPIVALIPGILHAKLAGPVMIHPQPPIPEEFLKNDPNMQVVPSFVLEWNEFVISGNFCFIAVAKKTPYGEWASFKAGIAEIHNELLKDDLISKITRYSIKYVDFFDECEIPPLDLLNVNINMSTTQLKSEIFTLHAEIPDDDYLNIIKIVSSATLNQFPGQTTRKGLVLETDTLRLLPQGITPREFMSNHSEWLDAIHTINKAKVFEIISDTALERMEPVYA